jgi:acyl-CoA synthetase (AMP-forming)/AMP-acid ligase II
MILNNILQVGRLLEYEKKQQKICIQVPLYHCFGMVLGSLATIAHGATAVYPGTIYNPINTLNAIKSEKCTSIYGTPTMYIDLLIHPELKNYDVSSLQNGIMSGSTVRCSLE